MKHLLLFLFFLCVTLNTFAQKAERFALNISPKMNPVIDSVRATHDADIQMKILGWIEKEKNLSFPIFNVSIEQFLLIRSELQKGHSIQIVIENERMVGYAEIAEDPWNRK